MINLLPGNKEMVNVSKDVKGIILLLIDNKQVHLLKIK